MRKKEELTETEINCKNLKIIQKNIIKHSPHPHKVKITAVTKTFSYAAIVSAENKKIFNIGESKIQETEKKLQGKKLNKNTKIHLIGHLQRNKASLAVKLFDVIESVDSIRLLNKINNQAEKTNKKQQVFLQINITKAPTQTGFKEKEINKAAVEAKKLQNIQMAGIMSIGTNTNNKKTIIKNFIKAKIIQKNIQKKIDKGCTQLSLGMSQDYILALQAGATNLRLGTILFKDRDAN